MNPTITDPDVTENTDTDDVENSCTPRTALRAEATAPSKADAENVPTVRPVVMGGVTRVMNELNGMNCSVVVVD